MNTSIKKLCESDLTDFTSLLSIFEETFEWESPSISNPVQLRKMLSNPYFIVFVAKTGECVTGGFTAYILESYTLPEPSIYIYDVAVTPALQRQGIGKKLIRSLQEYCLEKGFKEVFVQAETADAHAVNFYRNTFGGKEISAVQFTVC